MENKKLIKDCRGEGFKTNRIDIINGRPIYCGIPITDLQQTEMHRSKQFFNMVSTVNEDSIILGMIALHHGDLRYLLRILGKWKELPPTDKINYSKVPHTCINGVSCNLCDIIAEDYNGRCGCTEKYFNNLV